VIERILPATVVAVDTFADPVEAVLLPEEEPYVAGAVEARRREYTTVRHCARIALARLGRGPVAIRPGPRRAPCWPDGVVGSMTHCDGYRAAAVGRDTDVAALGIDAEPNLPLPADVSALVLRAEERRRLAALSAELAGVCWDRLLFSAKESVYKAVSPRTGQWLGFEDVLVLPVSGPDGGPGSFTVRAAPQVPAAAKALVERLTGRFLVDRGLVVTAVITPR
jgi:4'-phosphopantetheinyl transferase EntD